METTIGIGVLLAGIGVLWVWFAIGVYSFTRTGREGMRIQLGHMWKPCSGCRCGHTPCTGRSWPIPTRMPMRTDTTEGSEPADS